MSRYIDADELHIAAMDTEFYYAADEDVVLELINQQPTAEVQEVKHGKWVKHHEHINLADGTVKEWDNYYCAECKTPQSYLSKYCPECGVKMDLDVDEKGD